MIQQNLILTKSKGVKVFMVLEGKVVVVQGGGPTALVNQSLVGAVLESRKFPQITKSRSGRC